jgi:hypothetical protein
LIVVKTDWEALLHSDFLFGQEAPLCKPHS